MFLIDKPYVSDFLLETISVNKYPIIATEVAQELAGHLDMNWLTEQEARQIINNNQDHPIYTNSENSIAWLTENVPNSSRTKIAKLFKNKVLFRDLIKFSFPDFFYQTISLEEIQTLGVDDLQYPFVIKPSVGFFSLGVYIIHSQSDWEKAKIDLKQENLETLFPKDVINTEVFIIEEYIEGKEYAIDAYFDNMGELVILCILYHKFATGSDASDRVYTTSKEIFFDNFQCIQNFLQPIGKQLGLVNYPLHLEVRIDKNGKLIPIEINPQRFGGFCTTADLIWYSLGVNTYTSFYENIKPDWENVFIGKENNLYSIIGLNNNTGYTSKEIKQFDYEMLASDFKMPLQIRALDIKKYPVFGFVFAETQVENVTELDAILVSNLRQYIQLH